MRPGAAVRAVIHRHPSPNCGPRRQGARPDLIVLHYTGMQSFAAARDRLCDPASEVSAHYLITERGGILHLVKEEMRAWHAGAGQWGGVSDVNSRSIGLELVNTGAHPFPEPQMAALEGLLRGIMDRWIIPPERVIAHSDVAPQRKSDPGPRFDWRRLAIRGLSVWPQGHTAKLAAETVGGFADDARKFGYALGDLAPLEDVLRAFRLRFRPAASGPLDDVDCRLIADLARRFPVDRADTSA
ncbi:MAG: N-acetylmuramoyl-L-alanine amidase [Rhodobacteraceae bacterium CG17_big_fil_post_rev_8_21_14_2_50_63_15]|nr:N-acetylmuramoyl-L-alanine amidase [Roseovarius sp.]PIV78909.1 MAG: N-acetylmuramoyl-L-alanine amidase [Rhodobacteraceae bacterium CG17_big_fil_post_rev_8_21_14_2_50_63_15]